MPATITTLEREIALEERRVGIPTDQPLTDRAIARRRRFYVLPWPMAMVGWLLKRLPRPLYDFAFVHAPRKPRRPM